MSEDTNHEIVTELRKLKRAFYAMLIFFILACIPSFYTGLTHNPSDSQERAARLQAQQDAYDKRAKRTEDEQQLAEALLKRQEDSLTRFEKILDTWERQQKQYQTYLDSLGKK
jgi:predicted GIY-YIG superfamily endonuclease